MNSFAQNIYKKSLSDDLRDRKTAISAAKKYALKNVVSPSVPNEKTQSKKPPKKPRKVKKTPENRVFLELLPRFELGTSSLPRMRSTC